NHDSTCLPKLSAQSCRSPADTPIAPMGAFAPVALAVRVPAESGVCASVLYVLLKAVYGKRSHDSKFSSPLWPARWPSRMRAAATVVRLIPSPRKRMTFFARPDIAPLAAARAAPLRYHHCAVSPEGWVISGTSTAHVSRSVTLCGAVEQPASSV